MKAPVGLLSDGAVLRSKMEGLCPDKFRHDAQNADNARKNTAFPPVCKKCAKVCRAPENGKSHEESYDSSWDFGALEGTRIPGPLIKSQMLYRLSYERIFSVLHILPNNNTTTAPKKQEGSAKKWPVHRPQRSRPLSFMKKAPGQPCALAATPSLQMGRKPVQSKQNAPPRPVCGGAF